MFIQAANLYKMQKSWTEAGKAFEQAADCQISMKSPQEAAAHYVSAATCFKKESTSSAIGALQKAVEIYTQAGRFSAAAKHQKEIAELYEADHDLDSAIEAYEKASEYYSGEDSASSANQCLLKVAQFAAEKENYEKAYEIYENIAKGAVDNNLLKWSVKDYLFKAGLCRLATGDEVAFERAFGDYNSIDATFSGTREHKLLEDIAKAFKEENVELFTNVVFEFDSITKLDPWKTTMLLRIKNLIKSGPLI